ncbi:hypothetical protein O0I10_001109 [Lichtheimia ornata]|uniref:DUF7719 domain-containing protein n=1 Tax=Lichtheimia ornata TaxID=688661 RepID=A0AAD7Y358_9FUNG|nr:uncharacterized protein O0I10_001109 [Lichtheimia ornata]KAJ8662933.1 hypothetical protein O0I10_001109 [Lichtheimia ornata]
MGKKQSQRSQQQQQGPLIQRIPTKKPPTQDDIAESEKMRLMQQAGLLEKVKKREAEIAAENIGTAVYIWQAIFMSIPFGLLVGAFDVTVKVQYSEPWNYTELFIRSCKAMPALFPFIYITNRHRNSRWMQAIMAIGSTVVGAFLLYTLRNTPSLGQMARAPGLATIWIYFIIQLDLLPAVITLLLVALYWYFGLRDK